jgi:hypothetical protein
MKTGKSLYYELELARSANATLFTSPLIGTAFDLGATKP